MFDFEKSTLLKIVFIIIVFSFMLWAGFRCCAKIDAGHAVLKRNPEMKAIARNLINDNLTLGPLSEWQRVNAQYFVDGGCKK